MSLVRKNGADLLPGQENVEKGKEGNETVLCDCFGLEQISVNIAQVCTSCQLNMPPPA